MANFFHTNDGVRLAYDDEGTGPAVLLVHGFSCQAAHWAFQRAALLDAGYRVIGIDLRLHGRSETPPHGQRISRLGEDLRELLEHLDLQNVAVVAHSMGVSVTLAYFSLYGTDRVAAFVAIDQSPKIVNDESWHGGLRSVEWSNLWDAVNYRVPWGDWSREPAMPAHVQQLMAEAGPLTEYPEGAVRQLMVDHFSADWRDVLPGVAVPAWVATGRHSPVFPEEGMRMFSDALPKSSLSIFEHSGHCPHWNEPEAFNRELLAFLNGVTVS
ncbi:alpha/beta fold hydrolase [Paenarthrobacter ureafaciens]|uniref:alpha/beta fold hydrolase n=1 Tax=Paenarthrobacter ureafaciens TaxID=37931 RepID=UPI002DBD60E6|nr:alpha/beta hydrolase [Paenarthrobacter ureafaciens]MEC3853702.1 alpha/beta hydrolase [Paenarthrobacter ureafaciens]